ncbi:MAG: hypothetical protein LBF44_01795 [Holosporaceae bacterium]|jgi:hypothetical protein|nr:hypothetical protein [Holosporaceae bacterium]
MEDKKDDIKTIREEKLARLLLCPIKRVSEDICPIADFLEKSFVERVLWLEDQSRTRLSMIVQQCEACSTRPCGQVNGQSPSPEKKS